MNDNPTSLQLDGIEAALQNLTINATDQTAVASAISTLATASRLDPSLRVNLADPRVLKKLVETVECSVNDDLELTTNALRCIGNACIDNDAARQEVCNLRLSWAKQCLELGDDELKILAVKVIYNICHDYQPAQEKCYHGHLHYDLFQLYSSSLVLESADRTMLIDLLFSVTCQRSEPGQALNTSDAVPGETLRQLLCLPGYHLRDLNIEDFATWIEICLTFLRDPEVQEQVIDLHLAGDVWQLLQFSQDKQSLLQSAQEDSLADRKLLEPLSQSLTWILSDIAANSSFAQKYLLSDPLLQVVLGTIEMSGLKQSADENMMIERGNDEGAQESMTALAETDHPGVNNRSVGMITVAWQIAGNWQFNMPLDRKSHLMDAFPTLPRAAWEILSGEEYHWPDMLHSGAGLLVQLSRTSVDAREQIGGDSNAVAGLERLCRHQTPELKNDGIKLLKALSRDCSQNQQRFAALARDALLSSANGVHDGVYAGEAPS